MTNQYYSHLGHDRPQKVIVMSLMHREVLQDRATVVGNSTEISHVVVAFFSYDNGALVPSLMK